MATSSPIGGAGDRAIHPIEPRRRRTTARQARTVDLLLDAAADEARLLGYDGMAVRAAARRAGVAPATAYTHFASKDHLLAEVMWREMRRLLDAAPAVRATPQERLEAELMLLGTFMADEPALAAAGTTALLQPGPETSAIRMRIGLAAHDRLAAALGPDADEAVMTALDLLYTGALLWMGLGHLRPDQVPVTLVAAGRLILGGKR
ncbi:MAG TPA: TetR family transcriptional regulator [Acidimicrobiales bacterium]|jgi:AcrR family transcriptional regulator|nr:TetR family transcriptional regulator [Acidimicrobiales bacterium]